MQDVCVRGVRFGILGKLQFGFMRSVGTLNRENPHMLIQIITHNPKAQPARPDMCSAAPGGQASLPGVSQMPRVRMRQG